MPCGLPSNCLQTYVTCMQATLGLRTFLLNSTVTTNMHVRVHTTIGTYGDLIQPARHWTLPLMRRHDCEGDIVTGRLISTRPLIACWHRVSFNATCSVILGFVTCNIFAAKRWETLLPLLLSEHFKSEPGPIHDVATLVQWLKVDWFRPFQSPNLFELCVSGEIRHAINTHSC